MRVLFTTWAWPSHYFPMVPLAWALRAAGHDVLMTGQPELLPSMRASGLPAAVVGHDIDVASAYRTARQSAASAPDQSPGRLGADWIADRMVADRPPDGPATTRAHGIMRMLEEEARLIFGDLARRRTGRRGGPPLYGDVAEAMIDDLLAIARCWSPDLIVYDPLTYAGPWLADHIRVPAVRSLFGPDVTYFTNAASPVGLGVATMDPCPPGLQLADTVAPAHRIRTGYVPYNGVAEVPAWLPDRPARPRICLTWGTSIHRLFGEQAFVPEQVLAACTRLAEERGAELVLAITANQRHLLPPVPAPVRVVESVPLDALLPTCQALIHQGGAGTTLTALRHGLPQIILSQVFDQAANAYRLVAAGAGLTRSVAGLDAAQLLADGHELLAEPSYRDAAQRLRHEILHQPSPAGVLGELLALV